jgi:YfiH family protein
MWAWSDQLGGLEIRFTGKGFNAQGRSENLRSITPPNVGAAWLKQCHSATVRFAHAGDNDEGDALITGRSNLALSVVTADCVPVLLASPGQIAAVHAGWRGLVQRIVPAALEHFEGPPADLIAWIGPAIGPCCYEVGEEVAAEVVGASSPMVVHSGTKGRPHLDLHAAAALQLAECGVREIRRVALCTRCSTEQLWSYRRDGKGAGRNQAVIWRRG